MSKTSYPISKKTIKKLRDISQREYLWRDVIYSSTSYKVMQFDKPSKDVLKKFDSWLSQNLKKIIKIGEKYKARVNEFGNYIEDKILELFKHSDVKVNSPKK